MAQYKEISPFFSNSNVNQRHVISEIVQKEKSLEGNRNDCYFESNIDTDHQSVNEEVENDPSGKGKAILTDIVTTENHFTKWLIRTQLQQLENDLELQSLFKEQETEKNDNLELQMTNEKLSFERENAIASSEALISKIKNTWEVCNCLSNHCNRLVYFKEEEVDEFKNNFIMEMAKCSDNVKNISSFSSSLIEDYRTEIIHLKVKVHEERQHRINEVADAKCTFEIEDAVSKEEIDSCKSEEDRYASLMLEDQRLTKLREEAALKFKKDLENTNNSSYGCVSKNMLLENEISSSESKKSEIDGTVKSLLNQEKSSKNNSAVLEEELNIISNEVLDLTEELNIVKEKVSNLKVNVDEKRTKQETSERRKKELLEETLNCENELLIAKENLEDIKHKEMVSAKEVTELNLTLESNQSAYSSLNKEYEAEVSQLQSVLAEFLSKLNLKITESSEHKNKKDDISNEFEESDREMKYFESEIEKVKTTISEELIKMETLNVNIEEEKLKAEELNQLLILRQNEVEITKNDLEKTLKESSVYKEEMLSSIAQIKQGITDVKEKQKTTVSECNEKRQEIMKYLDECRNDSMKKSNEIEAEIDVERKKNADLKEKLNGIYSEKVSIERDSLVQMKIYERKIKELKDDLDSVVIKPPEWNISQVHPDKPSSVMAFPQNQVYMKPPPGKLSFSQPILRKDFVETDSDQSSIEFNDYLKRFHSGVNETSKKRKKMFHHTILPDIMGQGQEEKMQHFYAKRNHFVSSKKHMSTKGKRTTELEPLDLLSTL